MRMCAKCNGAIGELGHVYGWGGAWCHCTFPMKEADPTLPAIQSDPRKGRVELGSYEFVKSVEKKPVVQLTDAQILKVAMEHPPVSVFDLQDHVKISEMQKMVLKFARALLAAKP